MAGFLSKPLMEHVGGVILKGNGHNGDLNVTGNFRLRSFVPVCPRAIENSLPSRRMSLSHGVIFKLGSISPCPPCSVLDLTWASLAFAGTVRHLPPWIVTDFTSSILLLPWGGGAVLRHLLIVTVPGTSIRSILSAVDDSPATVLVCTQEVNLRCDFSRRRGKWQQFCF